MAKYFGKIGYAEQVETAPGVWEEQITERQYYGDVVRNIRKLESSGDINDNINVSMEIRIVAVDKVGAGIGELVLIAQGSAARIGCNMEKSPVDAAIVGIIDEGQNLE